MDIDLLSKMVKELILDNDRVVLPGLGCFVAEVVPATFSDKGYTINPPYRKLYFRSKPDMGDEIVDFYAETNSLDREVACRILGDFIAELKEIIYTRKVVIFPGLGRLRATKENNLFFIADENLDIYPAGFGLESISLKTHPETPQKVSAVVESLQSILEEPVAVPAEDAVVEAKEEMLVVLAEEPVAEEPVAEEPAAEEPAAEEPAAEDPAVEEPAAEEPAAEEPVVEEPDAEEPAAEEPVAEEPAVEAPKVAVPQKKVMPVWKKIAIVLGGLLAALVAFIILYMVVARIFPGMMDSILYTPEELEILNRF